MQQRRSRPVCRTGSAATRATRATVLRAAALSLVGAVLASALSGNPTAAAAEGKSTYFAVVGQGQSSDQLSLRNVGPVTEVDVTGLTVDLECAEQVELSAASAVRQGLLNAGCAKIVGSQPTTEEQAAQTAAQSARLGIWDTSSGGNGESAPESVGHWVSGHINLVLAILGLPLLAWLARRVRQSWHERRVHIVLAGPPSVGKTDLWTAWQHGDAAATPSTPSTRSASSGDKLKPIPHGRYTLVPAIVDTPGSQSGQIMEQLRKAPWRAKRILVMVLAPSESDVASGSPIDSSFVSLQKGYVYHPRALLEQDRHSHGHLPGSERIDAVVVFVTKFDLLSDVPATDSAAKAALATVTSMFFEHTAMLAEPCAQQDVPFQLIVGSARCGWGIATLRETVTNVIS